MSPRQAVGLDIGGTKIAAGVVDEKGTVVEALTPRATPTVVDDLVPALAELVQELRSRHPAVSAVGVGAAGLIDWPAGHVRWAPNNTYHDMPLRQLLTEATGLASIVDNDANVAAWAEARFGRSAGYMLFVTVGTGVGGGLILDGRLFRGRTGIGGEIGHLIVDPHSTVVCGCGNTGCLETLTSGQALGRFGREAAAAEPDGVLARLAGAPDGVTGEIVSEAAGRGDPTAIAVYDKLGHWLGVGLGTLTTLFDIELIVVGGGVSAAGELLLEPIRRGLAEAVFARDHRQLPAVVPATFGVEAGWIGAAALALDETAPDDIASDETALDGPGLRTGS